ncbi:MAG: 50S ribosomal protein L23 [Candidatus Moranbacteria bacterium]|nr:50S ribosomal protein L23 [Candidatus Moranbacteria bacterium]
MGIFDKILGKTEKAEQKTEKPEKKLEEARLPERQVKVEKKIKTGEKPVSAKAEKEKDKPEKKAKIVKTEKPKKEIAKRKVVKKEKNIAHKILLENLISEKATMLASQNKYVFKVDKNAGKFQIKEAIEGYYGVQVVSVNTIKISPKKRIQGRTIGWKKGFKKAVVTLRQGDTIGVVEGV